MESYKKIISISLVVMFVVFGILATGCSKKEVEPGSDSAPQTETNENESGGQQVKEQILSLNEMGKNKIFEVTADKVTTTDKLDSPEAVALLQTGEPGESAENTTPASEGKEYLLVTLKLKNIDSKPHKVFPVDVGLEDKDGKEYAEVVTNSYGGLFNMNLLEAGKEGQVTAVYEVVKGEKDLVLVYQPYGDDTLKFNIR